MNEEKKYKLIFGKEVAHKEFFNLQNESKLLKPASLNRILGKRDWKLKEIPELKSSKDLFLNQPKFKKRKLTRSLSFSEETREEVDLTNKKEHKTSVNDLINSKQTTSKENSRRGVQQTCEYRKN